MDTIDLGTLGLTIVTFALPLFVLDVDDIRTRRRRRRPVARRGYAPAPIRTQAHPMVDAGRS